MTTNTPRSIRTLHVDAEIHRVVGSDMNPNAKELDDKLALRIPTRLHTTDSVLVNEVKGVSLPGGIKALQLNGGSHNGNSLIFNKDTMLPMDISDFGKSKNHKEWTADYALAHTIATLANDDEIARLEEIAEQINNDITALKSINKANDAALVVHKANIKDLY